MIATIREAISWVSKSMSEQDGTPSSKRFAFVGSALGWGPALIVFLAFRFDGPIAVQAFSVWIAAVCAAFGAAKFADRETTPAAS